MPDPMTQLTSQRLTPWAKRKAGSFPRFFCLAVFFVASFQGKAAAQSTPQQISGSGWQALTTKAPAVASDGTNLYAAWRGQSGSGIWFSIYDGKAWSTQQVVGGSGWTAKTSAAPALQYAGEPGSVWLAWKGKGSDNRIWFSTWNGSSWSKQMAVAGTDPDWTAETTSAPTIGAYQTTPYVAWKGAGSDEDIWYSWLDDYEGVQSWITQATIGGSDWTAATSSAPSFTYDASGDPIAYWKGKTGSYVWSSTGELFYPACDTQAKVGYCGPDAKSNAAPSATAFANPIRGYEWTNVVFWKNSKSDQIFYNWTCGVVNGSTWSAATNVAPAAATFMGSGYTRTAILAWKNATDNTIWYVDPLTLPGLKDFKY